MDTTRVRHPEGMVWDDQAVSPDVPTPTDVADPTPDPSEPAAVAAPQDAVVPGPDAVASLPDAVASVIIEDRDIPRRVRRPLDLARFVLALVITGATVLVAWFATSTAAGLDDDISSGASLLPSFVVLALNIIGGIGTLGLPIAVAVNLTLRRRLRQLFDAFVALLIAVVVLTLASLALTSADLPRLLAALAGSTSPDSVATAPILGGLIAFITVARLMSRRPWNVLTVIVIGSLVVVTLLSGGIALAGVGISLAIGWAVGVMTRYIAGTPTTRPSGLEVAEALTRGGYPVTILQARESTSRGRRYMGTTRAGGRLLVTVLDRDLEGAGLANAIWTSMRLRDDSTAGAFNMRRSLDHAALVAYAAQAAGVPEPRLLLATEVGPDSVLLAYELVEGTRFSNLDEITDNDLVQAWRAMRTLHENQMTHRSLSAEHLLRAEDGSVWLIGGETGSIAAGDVAQRIDIAELLTTLTLLTDVDRAVDTGRTVLGVTGLGRALPALQPVALSPQTRKAIRRKKGLMVSLRDRLAEIRPDAASEQIQFERVRPRTLVMIIVGSIAGYVLLSQLAQVDLIGLLRTADWRWMILALVLSILTFVAAAWSLTGFVPERLPLHRTVMAQVAGSFATLVSPPTIGSIAINVRFLTKAGLHPALAGASVGVSQVMAFVFHIGLLLAFGIAAGTQADHTFAPPQWVVIVVLTLVVVALALLAVPAVRHSIVKRVRPTMKEVLPRLVTVVQRPSKLVEGIGGILLLNAAFIGVLYASVAAFGGELSIAVIAVVYLAGATLGQAAPTPGGLGAVEAALAAGLTAGGLDAGIAVSAVLLYRLVTFWLPTIPGYWAFNWLTKKGAL
jgi:glycosyltransferase 2 family protein